MSSSISARLDDDTVSKLEYLETLYGSRSEALRSAIATAYNLEIEQRNPSLVQHEYIFEPLTFSKALNERGAAGWDMVNVYFDMNENEPYVMWRRRL